MSHKPDVGGETELRFSALSVGFAQASKGPGPLFPSF